ncbi:MAG: Dyp-type peroxidase [Alysiella sp.]|uniref:Dyp-type peroxidase n=1 Tax=Alysiella sp. TaxID=1872483 RepID=UPI0026DC3DC4|nr:Dyp-type peroxidase [Alysiella sp.]MDO4433934.1 Dyp-type peroxidase [Alysiella sp.]
MPTPQSSIIPDHATAGIFIEADIVCREHIQAACNNALTALANIQQRYSEDQIGMTIAFGADFWQSLNHSHEGSEIKNFRALGNGLAPATQHDLLIHIQSFNHDSNYTLAWSVLDGFGDSIRVVSETHGFRRHEERGLDGFVDGTENPQGEEKITRIGVDENGGSYVLLQKYLHDLKKWDSFSLTQQEESIGRSRESNEEFSRAERHPRSHVSRSNLKENGVGLKIVRRSLPFGTVSGEHGLMFIAFCARLHNIEAQLLSMFGETDGQTDLILERLSRAVSGAYYFAPSIERLQDL